MGGFFGDQQFVIELLVYGLFHLALHHAKVQHHSLLIQAALQFHIHLPAFAQQSAFLMQVGEIHYSKLIDK